MGIFKHNCETNGHLFDARYDLIAPKPDCIPMMDTSVHGMELMMEKLTTKKYIYDICVKCGKIVKEAR